MAAKTYKGIYRQKSLRNPKHNYSSVCWYMITINTFGHKDYFGQVATTDNCPSLRATEIGDFAIKSWKNIPNHYPQILLDDFVFMPDHLHGLLKFTPDENCVLPQNRFGIQSKNLAAAIRAYKATVKRYANEKKIEFRWQSGYHDRIIYTEELLNNCRNYIQKNMSTSLILNSLKQSLDF
jgi:putative transposase